MRNIINVGKMLEMSLQNEDYVKRSDSELLEVFDEEGNSVGCAPRFLCHRLGLIHPVVFLIIEDCNGHLLLQTRGDYNKNRYDLPVGGHMNIDDKTPLDALTREMEEELGIRSNPDKFEYVCTYTRKSSNDLKKPKEMNYERRYLYCYKVDPEEKADIELQFAKRLEKEMVLKISWFTIKEIIEKGDLSMVADGLFASLPHYLLWKEQVRNYK